VCLVNAVEDVTARNRASEKLKYERAQEIVTGLCIEIRGIEVKVCHDGRSSFAYSVISSIIEKLVKSKSHSEAGKINKADEAFPRAR
jgi:hypothetical protein